MSRAPHLCALVLVVLGAACASKARAPAPETPSAHAPLPAHAVNAVVVANGCAHLGKDNAKVAESAMSQLVDGCNSFRGAPVRFTAELLPDGSIQFKTQPGQTESVPICVLAHPLKHRVKIQTACSLDVRLEAALVDVKVVDGG